MDNTSDPVAVSEFNRTLENARTQLLKHRVVVGSLTYALDAMWRVIKNSMSEKLKKKLMVGEKPNLAVVCLKEKTRKIASGFQNVPPDEIPENAKQMTLGLVVPKEPGTGVISMVLPESQALKGKSEETDFKDKIVGDGPKNYQFMVFLFKDDMDFQDEKKAWYVHEVIVGQEGYQVYFLTISYPDEGGYVYSDPCSSEAFAQAQEIQRAKALLDARKTKRKKPKSQNELVVSSPQDTIQQQVHPPTPPTPTTKIEKWLEEQFGPLPPWFKKILRDLFAD